MNFFDLIGAAALSSSETLQATYDLALNVMENHIEGHLVDCGVFAGSQCAAMVAAVDFQEGGTRESLFTKKRLVHAFDSFAGIPEAGRYDKEFIHHGHHPGLSACSLEDVQANMKAWGVPEGFLVYHKGLFADTVPEAAKTLGPIALLRLDCDLYESTKVCLDHLLPLVSPGGWVICDDFALSGHRRAILQSGLRGLPAYFKKGKQ